MYNMTITYLFDKGNRTNNVAMQREAISIIHSFFSNYRSLVGKPIFKVNSDKVIIQLFYYAPADSIPNSGISALGSALTHSWGRTVELRLIRLSHSALDSSILAQYLTLNGSKHSFNRILDMLKASLPTVVSEGSIEGLSSTPASHITGVKMKLSGRLTTQRSSPRQTVQGGRIGSKATSPYSFVDYSQHTAKNKLGAYTMKVWISQQKQ